MIDELFINPVITIPRAAELVGVGYTSAQKNVDRLQKAGILWEIGDRLFLAGEIVEAVEDRPLPRDLRRPE